MALSRWVAALAVGFSFCATGCGNDVAEQRSRQVALQQRIADLEASIDAFAQVYGDEQVLMPFVRIAADPKAFAANFKEGTTLDAQIELFAQIAASGKQLQQLDMERTSLVAGRRPPQDPAPPIDRLSIARAQIQKAIEDVRALNDANGELREVERRLAALGEKP